MKNYRSQARAWEHALVLIIPVLVFALMIFLVTTIMPKLSFAADQILTARVQQAPVLKTSDKTGNDYVRVIIEQERSLQGHKYTTGVPLMFFDAEQISQAMALTPGQTVKVIVSYRPSYDSYTAKKILTE